MEKQERRKGSWVPNIKKGKLHEILNLGNNPLHFIALPSGPTGVDVPPLQLCRVGVTSPRLLEALPPSFPPASISLGQSWALGLWPGAVWPVETEVVALVVSGWPPGPSSLFVRNHACSQPSSSMMWSCQIVSEVQQLPFITSCLLCSL